MLGVDLEWVGVEAITDTALDVLTESVNRVY